MISDETLADLLRLSERGDPGPWRAFVEGRDHLSGDSFIMVRSSDERGEDIYVNRDSRPAEVADLDLIAAARTFLPELVHEIGRLRAAQPVGGPELAMENSWVLRIVQALLGEILAEVLAVIVEFPGDEVVLRFFVARDSGEVREMVAEVEGELEALVLPDELPFRSDVLVHPSQVDWETWVGRMVYRAKGA